MRPEIESESDVSRLLRLAGPRPAVAADLTRRVHDSVHAHWQAEIAGRRRWRRRLTAGFLAAAAMAAALAVMVPRQPAAPAGPPLMILERAIGGGVRLVEVGRPAAALAVGAGVPAGAWIETPEGGRAAWRIGHAVSVRMDTSTRVHVLSASALWLERGGLYVDSGSRSGLTGIEIRTTQGEVRDIGTQFEVRAIPGGTRVRVREGTVFLLHRGERHEASAGAGLEARGGRVVRTSMAVFGPAWTWVEQAAPEPSIEGRSLESFVEWTARETGWTIRYARPGTARSAPRIVLHGSSAGLTPAEALEAVLPACGLSLRRDGGTAWIEGLSVRSERE